MPKANGKANLVNNIVLADLVEERSAAAFVCFLSLGLLQDSLFMACSISPMSVSRDSSSPFLSSLLDRKPDNKISILCCLCSLYILPSSKAFLTPTTVTEFTTLFFFLLLPKEQSEEKTSDIALVKVGIVLLPVYEGHCTLSDLQPGGLSANNYCNNLNSN